MLTFDEFIKWEVKSRDSIEVKRIYVDVADDLAAGVLLSQIIYWYLPDRNGKTKLQVEREGQLWLVKSRSEWWEECRLKPREADRAISLLSKAGIITVKIFKFKEAPTTHIRINQPVFLSLLSKELQEPTLEATVETSGNNESVISEITNPLNRADNGNNESVNYESVISISRIGDIGNNESVISDITDPLFPIKEAETTKTETTTETTEKLMSSGERSTARGDCIAEAKAIREVFDFWREQLHPDAKFTKERQGRVRARLREGYTVEQLKRAVLGCRGSPHHQGDNERQQKYDDLELICRSGSKVEQFIAIAEGGSDGQDQQRRTGAQAAGKGRPTNRGQTFRPEDFADEVGAIIGSG